MKRGSGERWGRSAAAAAIVAAAALVALPPAARALTVGPQGAFQLRGRVYTQYTIATEQTQAYTRPGETPGNMKQWRNFMNPELEVNLRSLAGIKWLDELSGRLALWGFYDAIYDFGPERYRQVLARYRAQELAYQSKGYTTKEALAANAPQRKGRDLYGTRARVNEAYVNIAKGPLFLRIGRQAISWGEADTIGLLDANNPFDTLIAPGTFIDIDESRIPLWTVRATYELFSAWGPFSSAFLDAYWVPGSIDTTISPLNINSVSPYSSPPPAQGPSVQLFDKLPAQKGGNSRWGVKLQTVIARDYNASLWFYKTFPVAPVPTLIGLDAKGRSTTQMNHALTNVIGAACSWYSETLNAVIRTELELFNGEPAFLAYQNIGVAVASQFTESGTYDEVNILRGELGMDRNLFIPALNPANSFTLVSSIVFTANLDESARKDYRAFGILKPSAILRQLRGGFPAGFYNGPTCDDRDLPVPPGQPRCDFVNMDPIQAFMQTSIQSDFVNGRLTPRLVTIVDFRGALAFMPSAVFRYSDALLLDVKYVNTHTFGSVNNGYTPGIGLSRDRDQLWLRATYQLE